MASGIFTTVKLEPFFQQFLLAHFEQGNNLVFTFPNGHDLQTKLNLLLSKKPEREVDQDYGTYTFRIELHYIRKGVDIRQHNFVSETASKLLAKSIRDYYSMLFHEFYNERYRRFLHTEICWLWIEQNGFDHNSYDRIERDARRYRQRNYNRNFQQKQKLKNVKSSRQISAVCPA